MAWFTDLFLKNKKAEETVRQSAKNRLQLVLIHDRENRDGPDFLPQLKLDIIAAIKKYIPIADEQVKVNVSQKDETSMMEVSVSLDPKYDNADTGIKVKYADSNDIQDIKSINDK